MRKPHRTTTPSANQRETQIRQQINTKHTNSSTNTPIGDKRLIFTGDIPRSKRYVIFKFATQHASEISKITQFHIPKYHKGTLDTF